MIIICYPNGSSLYLSSPTVIAQVSIPFLLSPIPPIPVQWNGLEQGKFSDLYAPGFHIFQSYPFLA